MQLYAPLRQPRGPYNPRARRARPAENLPDTLVERKNAIETIIAKMRATVSAGNVNAFDAASDEMRVFSEAFLLPSVVTKWDQYGLTTKQARIAEVLHARMNQGVSKEMIMNALYFDRPDSEPEIKIVDVFICKIRQKLENSLYRIETLWGKGYRMVEAPQTSEVVGVAPRAQVVNS